MAGGGGPGGTPIRSLLETPTWALATVCFVFISISILIEQLIHLVGQWLKKRRKNSLFEAVDKLKSVLMILGFMSLILTVTGKYIIKICVSDKVANTMLPCHRKATTVAKTVIHERILAAQSSSDYCGAKGKASIISQDGINQLSIFIFVLAVTQIVYSVITMALGRLKMRRWKAWECETQTVEYLAANDPNRFRYTRQTTFARRHMSIFTNSRFLLWIKCFFRQFFQSVAKVDYLTLRHGFIAAHLSNNNSFNFQKYIQRSLDHDFKAVVGISPFMWLFVVVFTLVDVHGWNVYLWVSFLPLVIVLLLGAKLEMIVAEMALELKDQSLVIKGAPLVQPNDDLFWLSRPKFVLTLIHYTLFVNSFEVAFFVWITLQFGIKSCYHENPGIIAIRVALAVTIQVLCSYITLPLYALVTQMGSQYKSAVLEEQTASILKKWHAEVKRKKKKNEISPSNSSHPSPSPTTSSAHFSSHNNHNSLGSPTDSYFLNRSPTFARRYPSNQNDEQSHVINQDIVPSAVIEINRLETNP
ncbi:hypothetical protein K2173_016563 [Erythroxylum novogranatense]|uniref:MLO-like protein n=1 Tax=Erythroxylum novogranatense TaxID=1862640 RepID=A0AAV8SGN1_9ROSI|nr:hypothetical protein K2173_016563 [Erythroxylum novogranatense]